MIDENYIRDRLITAKQQQPLERTRQQIQLMEWLGFDANLTEILWKNYALWSDSEVFIVKEDPICRLNLAELERQRRERQNA